MSSRAAVVAALALVAPIATAQVGVPDPPDPARAERNLARATRQLEEIIGRELAGAEPPPLPDVSGLALAEEQGVLVSRLLTTAPDDWTAEDRQLLDELLLSRSDALAELARDPRSTFSMESGLLYLRAGRLRSLETRLRWLEGDTAGFLEGIEQSSRLATSLRLQPQLMASILGGSLLLHVLEDAQIAVESPGTGEIVLDSIDWLLASWVDLPDAAATLAREALVSLAMTDELERTQPRLFGTALPEPTSSAFLSLLMQDYVQLTTRTRQDGARIAFRELGETLEADESPYRVMSRILVPSMARAVEDIEQRHALTELAKTAVALRQEAARSGAYPAHLGILSTTLAAARGELPELTYTPPRSAGEGARLQLAAPESEPQGQIRRGMSSELAERLRVWDLPPVAPLDDL